MIKKFLDNRNASKQQSEKTYTFVDHLEELRWVLFKSLIAIAVCSVIGFVYVDFFFNTVLMAPTHANFLTYRLLCWFGRAIGMQDSLCMKDLHIQLQSTRMGGQFLMSFSLALAVGAIVSFPYVMWQLWTFIRPALSDKESQNTRLFIFWLSLFFFLGISFGYFVIAPYSIQFFANYTLSADIENRFMISDYISHVLQITVGAGVFFELPLLVYILVKIGILTSALLSKSRKHALLIILILAAIITPPDVVSQIIITFPIYLLYEFSIFIARRVEKRKLSQENPL